MSPETTAEARLFRRLYRKSNQVICYLTYNFSSEMIIVFMTAIQLFCTLVLLRVDARSREVSGSRNDNVDDFYQYV
jgi:hypothetical protein